MSYTENTDNDYLECCKCGQSVDQILSLSCDHNLCLNCAAKTVHKWKQMIVYPPLICQICSSKTQLDPSAVQVLLDINPQYSCCTEESESKSEVLETKQSQQIIQIQQPIRNITCQQHMTESCVLYCITCETQCFCMECYLQGLHKNHEVRNITKAFDIVKGNGNQLIQQLQGCSEYLLHEQCKIANKKQDLLELIGQAKQQITQSFQELYKTLNQKEQELLQAADELAADKLIEIEGLVAKIKGQTESANQYSDQLITYFSSSNINTSLCVEANNYIVKEKKKIQNLVEQVKSEKVSPTIQSKFCLDQGSIQQMISDMRGVKLQLMSLRGIETTNPTQREKYVYDKAIEEKQRDFSVHQIYYEEQQKENNNSMSFIERSSQRKSISSRKNDRNGDFYSRFNEAKKQILNQRAQQNY